MRLAKKLGIKEGMRLVLSGAPEGYFDLLAPLPAGAEIVPGAQEEVAFVQYLLRNPHDLELLTPEKLKVCGKNCLLWVTYPKVSSAFAAGLSREVVRAALRRFGWRAVTIVAVDGTWAALRFRLID